MELTAVIRALESLGKVGRRKAEGGSEEKVGSRKSEVGSSEAGPLLPTSDFRLPTFHVELIGDSEYVLKGLTEWLPGWKKRNWRKADKKPVLNADLWKKLDELAARHHLTITWVRGHTGHPENERCDLLAKEEAEKIGNKGLRE
jgi:ribonuclease HI